MYSLIFRAALACLVLLAVVQSTAGGPLFNLQPGLTASTLLSGFGPPVETCNIDGSRALILIKSGQVLLYSHGAVSPNPLLDLRSRPDFMLNGEAGLMSCLATRDTIWLYYSTRTNQVVSRFSLDGSFINPASEVVLFTMENGGSAFHTGSAMQWSNDNKELIYLARGDAAMCDINSMAGCASVQNLGSYFGKILRIDRDGNGLADNPFWTGNPGDVQSRVWTHGFRNPWSFLVLPDSGRLLVFDVGKGEREMVKIVGRGSQGNWPCYEGSFTERSGPYSGDNPLNLTKCSYLASPVDLSTLLHEYSHAGQGASIIGGAIMSPLLYRAPYGGRVLYADYVRGWVRHAAPAFTDTQELASASAVVRIKNGPNGQIWVLSLDGDMVQELRDTEPPAGNNGASCTASTTLQCASGCCHLGVCTDRHVCFGGSPPPPLPPPPPPPPGPCDPPLGARLVPSLDETVYQPLMFASQPELGWECVRNDGGLPCARDGRMDTRGTRPMLMNGRRYSRGFGVRGNSEVTVPLDGRCGSLLVTAGLDDSSSRTAAATFTIVRDGVQAFQSRTLKRGWTRNLRINLVGVKTLTLITTQTSPGFHNAIWANPILACGPDSPYLPTITAKPVGRLQYQAEQNQTVQVLASAKDWKGEEIETKTSFDWQLNIRHCQGALCHSHPGQRYVRNSMRAWFQLTPHPDCVWYELQIDVTDTCGRKAMRFVTVAVPSKERVCTGTGVDGTKRRLGWLERHNHNQDVQEGYEEEEEEVIDVE